MFNTELLSTFQPIFLDQLGEANLLKRIDTKYVFPLNQLEQVLENMSRHYDMLEVEGSRLANYKTTYYDTQDLKLFHVHLSGKKNRYKLRKREYLESGISFLELKRKSNKGITNKTRIKLEGDEPLDSSYLENFLSEKITNPESTLKQALDVYCHRFTLVNRGEFERVTFDVHLAFEDRHGEKTQLDNMVIAEVKKSPESPKSPIQKVFDEWRIKPRRISKYCMGVVLLLDDVKYNNYKPKLRALNKTLGLKLQEHRNG